MAKKITAGPRTEIILKEYQLRREHDNGAETKCL